MIPPRVTLVCSALTFVACSTDIPRTNTYDANGSGPKAPGRIAGQVFVQGVDPLGLAVRVFDAAGSRVDGDTLMVDAEGEFLTAELAPSTYRVDVEVPAGNVPLRRDGVEVLPGATTDLGLLVSLTEPPSGSIAGVVQMSEALYSPADVRVVAVRKAGTAADSRVTFTNTAGEYAFAELPPGDYELRADKSAFTPDLTDVTVDSLARATSTAPTMHLHPGSAVVRFEAQTGEGRVIGAPYTNEPSVDVLLLAFGNVNEMRLSEQQSFVEGGVEVSWRDHVAQIPIVLSPGEGPKRLYAQFRVVDGLGNERLRTETYAAEITLDESAPVVVSMSLAPNATVVGGVRYLTTDPTAVPVSVLAVDPLSRIAGYRFLIEDADPALVPYADVTSLDATATLFEIVSLSISDGLKTVGVQLTDGAGNESSVVSSSVVIDTQPPALLASPAVTVRGAESGRLTSLSATLQFSVGADPASGVDGPARMRYGLAPAPPSGTTLGFVPEVSFGFAAVHGQQVQFYGAFSDVAGNEVVALSPIYDVNLRGSLAGKVLLDGVSDGTLAHENTLVEVFAANVDLTAIPAPTPIVTGATQPNGSFAVADIPAGTYLVRLGRLGYIPRVRSPVVIAAGDETQLGIERLVAARGDLVGTFLFGDVPPAGDHAGITVAAILAGRVVLTAVTDNTGAVTLAGLPVAPNYEIRASAPSYVTASVLGVAVAQDQGLSINGGAPTSLAKIAGDFKICDRDDATSPPRDCAAILHTNDPTVLLGLDSQNVTHVRYVLEDPLNPGVDSFTNSLPPGDSGADLCGVIPAEQCWNVYDPAARYLVDVSAREALATVLVQFANNADLFPIGRSQVVYDVTPPLSPSVVIARGAAALTDGYTNDTELSLTVAAVATSGASGDAAPLATVRISRDATWSGDGVSGDREYSYGGAKLFDVSSGDGFKDVYAWFCDAAGNCTDDASPAHDSVILDTEPPTRVYGRDIVPVGAGVTVRSVASRTWWTRATRYAVDIDVGRSPYGIPDVVAYRVSLSPQFVNAEWVQIDLEDVLADETVTGNGVELPPVDGDYVVWSQFADAAGNLSAEAALDELTLTLDTVPPGGSVLLASGATYTRDPVIAVALGTDDAVQMQTTWDGVLPSPYDLPSRVPYAAGFTSSPADLGDGPKELVVRIFDAAGNFAERADQVFLDRTPPDPLTARVSCASCTFDDSDNTFFRDVGGNVTLSLFAQDNSGSISAVRVVVDGAAATPRVLQYAPYQSLTVSTDEGPHALDVTFEDPAGNSTTLPTLDVELDSTAPVATLVIDAGAEWTRDAGVTLDITGTDANAIESMLVANSATFAGAAAVDFAAALDWTLLSPTADDEKYVYVRLIDAAGNHSDASDAIKLDTTAPTLAPALAGAAAGGVDSTTVTRAASVRVTLSAADNGGLPSGLFEMQASNNADFAGATWLSFADAVAGHPLAEPALDGLKTVYVRVSDHAGNVSSAPASITLDTRAPTGSVVLAGGADAVTSPTAVPAALAASDDVRAMKLVAAAAADCAAQVYATPYSASAAVDFGSPSDGPLYVTACFEDAAGNTGGAEDSVLLDRADPAVTLLINGGTGALNFTNSPRVLLDISAADATSGVRGVRVANSSSLSGLPWDSTIGATLAWQLGNDAVDEQKTVYAQVVDGAGRSSSIASATIVLDRAPPTGSISVVGNSVSQSATVSVSVTRGDADTTEMAVGQGALDCAGASYVPFDASPPSLVLSGTGQKTLSLCLRDRAGNTAAFSTEVTIDIEPPTGTLHINNGATYTTDRSVTLNMTASSDVTQYKWTTGTPSCADPADYGGINLAPTVSLDDSDAVQMVSVCLKDRAGWTALLTDSITLDRAGPVGGAVGSNTGIQLAAGAATTDNVELTATLLATDSPSGMAEMKLSQGSGCAGGAWQPYATSASFTVDGGDGVSRAVSVLFKDNAGNAGACYTDSIDVDDTGPTSGSITIARGASATADGYTNAASVTVTLFAQRADYYQLGTDVVDLTFTSVTAPKVAMSGTSVEASFCLEGGTFPSCTALPVGTDRTQTIYARFYDALGNASNIALASIQADNTPPAGLALGVPAVDTINCITVGATTTCYSRSQILTVNPTMPDNAGLQMQLSGDGVLNEEPWLEYAASASVVVSSGACTAGTCTVRAVVRDRAGNVSAPATADVVLDLVPPVGPKTVRANDIVTSTAYTLGIVPGVVSDTNFWRFEITGGQYATFDDSIADMTDLPVDTSSFPITLNANDENTVRIRAVDKAGNVSTDDFTIVLHDDTPPVRPASVKVSPYNGQLRIHWQSSASTDVVRYDLYYGTTSGLYNGAGAAEGTSPIQVGLRTSYNLTGLPNGNALYVVVRAIDRAGNVSAPSSEQMATPSVVAPRLLSQLGGRVNGAWVDVGPTAATTDDRVLIPFDGGLKVFDATTSGEIAFIPGLPDVTQVFVFNGYTYVHSSDPRLGPVPSSEDELAGMPNMEAPVRSLSVFSTTYPPAPPVDYELVDELPLPDRTAFFYVFGTGPSAVGVSATLGMNVDFLDGSLVVFGSELTLYQHTEPTEFTAVSTTTLPPVSAWGVLGGQYLVLGSYDPGAFEPVETIISKTSYLRTYEPTVSGATVVAELTIDPVNDGTYLPISELVSAQDLLFSSTTGPEAPSVTFVDVINPLAPVAHGSASAPTDPLVIPVVTATTTSLTWDPTDYEQYGEMSFYGSPALLGRVLDFGGGLTRTLASYTMMPMTFPATFNFAALPSAPSPGSTFTIALDETPGYRGVPLPAYLRQLAADPADRKLFVSMGSHDGGEDLDRELVEYAITPDAGSEAATELARRGFSSSIQMVRAFADWIIVVTTQSVFILPRTGWSTAAVTPLAFDPYYSYLLPKDGYVYAIAAADGSQAGVPGTIAVVDVSRPERPATVGHITTTETPTRMAADGNRLYVLEGQCWRCGNDENWSGKNGPIRNHNCECQNEHLETFTTTPTDRGNIIAQYPSARPDAPVSIGRTALAFGAVDDLLPHGVELLAWSTGRDGSGRPHFMRMYGQATGQAPGVLVQEVRPTYVDMRRLGLAKSGRYVFVPSGPAAYYGQGISAYRLVDDTTMTEVAGTSGAHGTNMWDLQVVRDVLFAFDDRGLTAYDVADILAGTHDAAPPLGTMSQRGSWRGAATVGGVVALGYAYAMTQNGVVMIDVTDPDDLRETYTINVKATDVAVEGGYLYLTSERDGLRIYELLRPSAFRTGAHYQNGTVELGAFALAQNRAFGRDSVVDPNTCYTAAQTGCDGRLKCSWDAGNRSCEITRGIWTCALRTTQAACGAELGCIWDPGASACLDQSTVDCSGITSEDACEAQLKCRWDYINGCMVGAKDLGCPREQGPTECAFQPGCAWDGQECLDDATADCSGLPALGCDVAARCLWDSGCRVDPSGSCAGLFEQQCNNEPGCNWDVGSATCLDSPDGCAAHDVTTCDSLLTCRWNVGSSSCERDPYAAGCATVTEALACLDEPGCGWDGGASVCRDDWWYEACADRPAHVCEGANKCTWSSSASACVVGSFHYNDTNCWDYPTQLDCEENVRCHWIISDSRCDLTLCPSLAEAACDSEPGCTWDGTACVDSFPIDCSVPAISACTASSSCVWDIETCRPGTELLAFDLGVTEAHESAPQAFVPLGALHGAIASFSDDSVWAFGPGACAEGRCLDVSVFDVSSVLVMDTRRSELSAAITPTYPIDNDGSACDTGCCPYQECRLGVCTSTTTPQVWRVTRGASTDYFALVRDASGHHPNNGIYVFEQLRPYDPPSLLAPGTAAVVAGASGCAAARPDIDGIHDILWTQGVLYAAGRNLIAMGASAPGASDFLDYGDAMSNAPVDYTDYWRLDGAASAMCSQHLAAAGHYLYVLGTASATTCAFTPHEAGFTTGIGDRLWIFDIASPMAPVPVGAAFVLPAKMSAVVATGSYVFLSDPVGRRVWIIDAGDRAAPSIQGAFTVLGDNVDLAVVANQLFVNGGYAGLNAVDGR